MENQKKSEGFPTFSHLLNVVHVYYGHIVLKDMRFTQSVNF